MKQALWTFSLIRNFEKLQLAIKNVKIEINLSEGQVYMKLFTFLSRDIINKIPFFIHASLKRGKLDKRKIIEFPLKKKKEKDTRNWRIFKDYLTKEKNVWRMLWKFTSLIYKGYIIFISAIEA